MTLYHRHEMMGVGSSSTTSGPSSSSSSGKATATNSKKRSASAINSTTTTTTTTITTPPSGFDDWEEEDMMAALFNCALYESQLQPKLLPLPALLEARPQLLPRLVAWSVKHRAEVTKKDGSGGDGSSMVVVETRRKEEAERVLVVMDHIARRCSSLLLQEQSRFFSPLRQLLIHHPSKEACVAVVDLIDALLSSLVLSRHHEESSSSGGSSSSSHHSPALEIVISSLDELLREVGSCSCSSEEAVKLVLPLLDWEIPPEEEEEEEDEEEEEEGEGGKAGGGGAVIEGSLWYHLPLVVRRRALLKVEWDSPKIVRTAVELVACMLRPREEDLLLVVESLTSTLSPEKLAELAAAAYREKEDVGVLVLLFAALNKLPLSPYMGGGDSVGYMQVSSSSGSSSSSSNDVMLSF